MATNCHAPLLPGSGLNAAQPAGEQPGQASSPRSSRPLTAVLCAIALAGAAVHIETVPVLNPGNLADSRMMDDGTTGYGAVNYEYRIGKYEVTAGQYTAFLNAVGSVDTYALHNEDMLYSAGITRSGLGTVYSPYRYSVSPDWVNRPINRVSWGDAARFANWLHNGQPTGAQDATTTEDGAYALLGAITNEELMAVNRKADARWAIPSEDEWYKAAYHKNNGVTGDYWTYATRSDFFPGRDLTDLDGNNANYEGTPFPIDGAYYMTRVGQFRNSKSPYGTFDQNGNVCEWNEAVIHGWEGLERGYRGGSWYSALGYFLHPAFRPSVIPTWESAECGFRVVALGLDVDGDNVPDGDDNCPQIANEGQEDADGDGSGDACDECPDDANKSAAGSCGCGIADADSDGDGAADCLDNCAAVANSDQADADGDGIGDLCETCPLDSGNDADGDGVCGDLDHCPDSILSATLVVGDYDTGVTNHSLGNGCSMADELAKYAHEARNHGAYVRAVAQMTTDWMRAGLITGREKSRIQWCAAKSKRTGLALEPQGILLTEEDMAQADLAADTAEEDQDAAASGEMAACGAGLPQVGLFGLAGLLCGCGRRKS